MNTTIIRDADNRYQWELSLAKALNNGGVITAMSRHYNKLRSTGSTEVQGIGRTGGRGREFGGGANSIGADELSHLNRTSADQGEI